MKLFTSDRRAGPFIVGLVAGAAAASVIFSLARIPQDVPAGQALDALIQIHSLYAWRVSAVVGPLLLIPACASAIRGRLRPAAWMVLGWASFEFLGGLAYALRYWP